MKAKNMTGKSSGRSTILCVCLLLARIICRAGYPNNVDDGEDELLADSDGGDALPVWLVSEPYINLWIQAEPLSYNTSWGKSIGFRLAYKHRNSRSTTNVFGLGPNWECSWLSYVKYQVNNSTNPPIITIGKTYVTLGGERSYVPDGTTKEYKSTSTMTKLTDGNGNLTGFRIDKSDGGQDVYSYLLTVSTNENYALLTQQIDQNGRTNRLTYDTLSNIARLRSMVDWDNRTNSVGYDSTYTTQISAVTNHYGVKACFTYDTSGRLSSVTNAADLPSSFVYDSQGLVTNLVTPYGTARFKATTNSFAPYNLGGTNQINRAIEVTEADGVNKQLFLYRDQSTKLNPTSSVDLIPYSYPTNEVPNTSPLSNTLDNAWMDARNSFHWDRKQYSRLSTNYLNSGDLNNLTTNDYKITTLSHWLRGYTNSGVLKATVSLMRDSSPDGNKEGQKTWFDYSGKATVAGNYWGTLGTNATTLFVAKVLPDATSQYAYTERNKWEHPTRQIGTYSSGASVATRTNTFSFAANAIDLIEARGPLGELLSSNLINGFHQVITNISAAGYISTMTYASTTHGLTSTTLPTGLISSNYYFTSGTYLGWLSQTVDYDGSVTNPVRTNLFTYTNSVILTQTDARGLTVTNGWDSLLRPITVTDPSGASTNSYNKLDLTQKVDHLNHTNQFCYDSMDHLCQLIDARGGTNSFGYADPSGLTSHTNACQQSTGYSYDLANRVLTTTFADRNSVAYSYNLVGQITNVVDSLGNRITNVYNNQGLLIASGNAFGQVYSATYDVRDRITNIVTADGVSVNITYDNSNRPLTKTYPDGGVERLGHSPRGIIAYTNRLGFATTYGYDSSSRLIAVTNANNEVVRYSYSPAGDLLTLIDGKNQTNRWGYDQFGRVTNQVDAAGNTVFTYQYDGDGRLTNRWSAAKGNTSYTYDQNGNLVSASYPVSPPLSFAYDAENQLTNMTDAVGTTRLAYTSFGASQSEDGPWDNDTVTYGYDNNRMRNSLAVTRPNASPWVQTYIYDSANRLQTLISPAGAFTYSYKGPGNLVTNFALPNNSAITNAFDSVARVTGTWLRNSGGAIVNSHTYGYNLASQRTTVTNFAGNYLNFTYDNIGQLKTAAGKETGGSSRLHEQFGYAYDSAGNLSYRTNNVLIQTFGANNLNELTNVTRTGTLTVAGTTTSAATNVTVNALAAALYGDKTFSKDGFTLASGNNSFTAIAQDSYNRKDTNVVTVNLPPTVGYVYDLNGNLTSDGTRGFDYDDDNQLIRVTVTNSWKSEFTYDGKFRRRIRKEYAWQNSSWAQCVEVHYIYDGMLVIQERDVSNLPTVSYTRGRDLSGRLDAAGGIAGLLARSDLTSTTPTHAYYHADGNGNVTALVNSQQVIIAKYIYDPFGNILANAGPLADANLYRFSSKEVHQNSGLIYFGRRFYDSNIQRWINQDPVGIRGGLNLYVFAGNDPIADADIEGLWKIGKYDLREVAPTDFPLEGDLAERIWPPDGAFGISRLSPIGGGTRFSRSYTPSSGECRFYVQEAQYEEKVRWRGAGLWYFGHEVAPLGYIDYIDIVNPLAIKRHELHHMEIEIKYVANTVGLFESRLKGFVTNTGRDRGECARKLDYALAMAVKERDEQERVWRKWRATQHSLLDSRMAIFQVQFGPPDWILRFTGERLYDPSVDRNRFNWYDSANRILYWSGAVY